MMKSKVCQLCGDSLKGRTDKRFCDDNCRASYHNQKKKLNNLAIRKVNAVLLQNRYILSCLMQHPMSVDQQEAISVNRLLDMGYNFNFFTHYYKNSQGHLCQFCYDYGIVFVAKDAFVLLKNNDT
jgi:predicted nucleic acid-binding Zn ribbon protein